MAAKPLIHEGDWKRRATWSSDGYFRLETADVGDVPVRLFLTE
jgi:tRNA-splicing ligase RtcB